MLRQITRRWLGMAIGLMVLGALALALQVRGAAQQPQPGGPGGFGGGGPGGFGPGGRGGFGGGGGMMMGGAPMSGIAASGDMVYVLRGNTVFALNGRAGKVMSQTELPMPQGGPGGPGGAGRPGFPGGQPGGFPGGQPQPGNPDQ